MVINPGCLSCDYGIFVINPVHLLVSNSETNSLCPQTKWFYSSNTYRKNHDIRGAVLSTLSYRFYHLFGFSPFTNMTKDIQSGTLWEQAKQLQCT